MSLPKASSLREVREGEGHRPCDGGPFSCVEPSRSFPTSLRAMIDRHGCWEYNVSVCLAGRCGYRATLGGPEFMDEGCSGGKGAHNIDSRRRNDV